MKNEIGSNVIAISHSKDGVVYFFGCGIYEGDSVPPANVGGFMGKALHESNISNPCILLKSGKRVYGCECWWGNEKKTKERFKNYTFEEVDIDEDRKSFGGS